MRKASARRVAAAWVVVGLGAVGAAMGGALGGCASAPHVPDTGAATLDLGSYHRRVSTTSPEAQRWFDRGLTLLYAFNHEEAIRCFQRAQYEDPNCAMAWWGEAYALGPHINKIDMDTDAARRAIKAQRKAEALATEPGAERDLIVALRTRYATPSPKDRKALDRAYSQEMLVVREAHPRDADVAALYAESMMMLRPWKQWSKEGEPEEGTAEVVATLESGLAMAPDHPALCHFYIHAVEASRDPGRALPAANRLRTMVPDAGHLVHMPSHIDALVGHWADAIEANRRATAADGKYLALRGANNFYTLYRAHAYHFIAWAGMFSGRQAESLEAAREITRQVPMETILAGVDYLDGFVPTDLHVMIRFGMWDEILSAAAPDKRLPLSTAIWHYARGVAFAAQGHIADAVREQEAFEKARAKVPSTSIMFNNTSADILGIASAMLEGEVAYRQGRHDEAFASLREAALLDDALNYDEPWGWMQPARHALGALLLEQGRVSEAEAVYREDLKRRPENVWSLHGLAEALRRSGNAAEADAVERRLKAALVGADIEVKASCACRTGAKG